MDSKRHTKWILWPKKAAGRVPLFHVISSIIICTAVVATKGKASCLLSLLVLLILMSNCNQRKELNYSHRPYSFYALFCKSNVKLF